MPHLLLFINFSFRNIHHLSKKNLLTLQTSVVRQEDFLEVESSLKWVPDSISGIDLVFLTNLPGIDDFFSKLVEV